MCCADHAPQACLAAGKAGMAAWRHGGTRSTARQPGSGSAKALASLLHTCALGFLFRLRLAWHECRDAMATTHKPAALALCTCWLAPTPADFPAAQSRPHSSAVSTTRLPNSACLVCSQDHAFCWLCRLHVSCVDEALNLLQGSCSTVAFCCATAVLLPQLGAQHGGLAVQLCLPEALHLLVSRGHLCTHPSHAFSYAGGCQSRVVVPTPPPATLSFQCIAALASPHPSGRGPLPRAPWINSVAMP